MAQFDVYINPNPDTKTQIPYLLDVQAELLDSFATRVIIPVYHAGSINILVRQLNPVIQMQGEKLILSTSELAAVPTSYLGVFVENISHERHTIITAIDLLITGV